MRERKKERKKVLKKHVFLFNNFFRATEEISGSIFWFSLPLVGLDDAMVQARGESDPNSSFCSVNVKSYSNVGTLKRPLESNVSSRKNPRISEDLKEESDTKKTGVRKRKALVIDDSSTIRKVIERVLVRLGFEVSQAENGMEGLNEMKGSLFDVVFCDFLMPIMDGLDCVKQYREWEKKHRPWFQQVS